MRPSCSIRYDACTWCGRRKPVTDDHIPPRSLFPNVSPKKLPYVPGCYTCNTGASPDDEYFRHVVVGCFESNDPNARDSWQAFTRSLSRPEASRFSDDISARLVDLPDPDHIGFIFDTRRVNRTVARITRGLHRFVHGTLVPPSHKTLGTWLVLGANLSPHLRDTAFVHEVLKLASRAPVFAVSTLEVRNASINSSEQFAAWLITLYNNVALLGYVLPASKGQSA